MTEVVYFSSTGNSLVTARRLAEVLGAGPPRSIRQLKILPRGEGFRVLVAVFPVYMWGLPRSVLEFFESLILSPGVVTYAVATHGGLPGDPFRQLRRVLDQKGYPFGGGFLLWSPENFIVRYEAWPSWLQRFVLGRMPRRTASIGRRIAEGQTGHFSQTPPPLSWVLTAMNQKLTNALFRDKTLKPKDFLWVQEHCKACGCCVRVCPRENISMDCQGKVTFGDDCELCVGCIQWCPHEALQAGATPGRRRYHHPEVDIKDFFVR